MASEYPASAHTLNPQDPSNDGPPDPTKAQADDYNDLDEEMVSVTADLVAAIALVGGATDMADVIAAALNNSVQALEVTTNWNAAVETIQTVAAIIRGKINVNGVSGTATSAMTNLSKPIIFEGVTSDAQMDTGPEVIVLTRGLRLTFKDMIINSIAGNPTLVDCNDQADVELIFENCTFLFADPVALILDPNADCIFTFINCTWDSSVVRTSLIDRAIDAPVSGITLIFDGCQMGHPNTTLDCVKRGALIDAFLDITVHLRNRTFLDRPNFLVDGASFVIGGLKIYTDGTSFATDLGDATGNETVRFGTAFFDERMIEDMFDLTGRADLHTTAQGTADILELIGPYSGRDIKIGVGRMAFDNNVGLNRTNMRVLGSGRSTIIEVQANAQFVLGGIGLEFGNMQIEANHTLAVSTSKVASNSEEQFIHDLWFDVGTQVPSTTTGAGEALSISGDRTVVERINVFRTVGRAGWGAVTGIIHILNGANEVILRHCKIDVGSASTPDSPIGIRTFSDFATIENCTIRGDIEVGIEIRGETSTISNCHIDTRDLTTSTGVGIRCIEAGTENISIIDCIIERADLYGIQVGDNTLSHENIFISGCKINDGRAGSTGIRLDVRSAPFAIIQNCYIKNDISGGFNSMDIGIHIIESVGSPTPSQRVWVIGNTISHMNSFGEAERASIVIETGTTVAQTVSNGIVVKDNNIYCIRTLDTGIIWKGNINSEAITVGGVITNNTIFFDNTDPGDGIRVVNGINMMINGNEIFGKESGSGSNGINLQNVTESIVEGGIVHGMDVGFLTDANCGGNMYRYHVVNNTTPETINAADTSNNNNKADTFVNGDMVRIGAVTASGDATVEFADAIDSKFKFYVVKFWCIPVDDNVSLLMRVSTDGGSSFANGASDYKWSRDMISSLGAHSAAGDNADASIQLASLLGSDTNESGVGSVTIFEPSNATIFTHIRSESSAALTDAREYVRTVGGAYLVTTAVNGFQFLFSAGNIESGEFVLYGVR